MSRARSRTLTSRAPHDAELGRALPVTTYLKRLHARYASLRDGQVAAYIPELAKADADWFGIAIATVDGAVYETGDSRQSFTIQSMSKPLTYGIALEDRGETDIRRRIGVEPTGDAFNSIQLAPATGTPLNPMVNAGAITATSLIRASGSRTSGERILDAFGRYAGRALAIDDAVFRSESETGHRNRAIGHLLRASGAIDGDPDEALERYFEQCSILVDCRDLAVIAGTLANGGVNPITGERAVEESVVRSILSVMTTCGMYDAAGEWLYAVGLPAKSGVSGGIFAVLPGQLGIGVFSPPLDDRGNSVRGLAVCRDASRELNLHIVASGGAATSPLRARYTLAERSSKRSRSQAARRALDRLGPTSVVFEVQGDLSFLGVETISRAVLAGTPAAEATPEDPSIHPAGGHAIVDLRRVDRVDLAVAPIFADTIAATEASGGQLVLSDVGRHLSLIQHIDRALGLLGRPSVRVFDELDLALEWSEEAILEAAGGLPESDTVRLDKHDVLAGLSATDVVRLRSSLMLHRFESGELIVHAGDVAEELFLVTRGRLAVSVTRSDGRSKRLAVLGAGSVFGEIAFLGGERRTADVRAESGVECYVLTSAAFERLGAADPRLKAAILENLLHIVGRVARRMTDELATLGGGR